MSFHYNWSVIDGYQCPLRGVISRRGLGKTFGKVKSFAERFVTKGQRFVYVVETGEMLKELCRNNGEKFWSALLSYYEEQDTSRKRYFHNRMSSCSVSEEEDTGLVSKKPNTKVSGGVIYINSELAGYIIDLNSFADLKRNNFVKIKNLFIDEFISEKMDKTTLQNPKKIVSIIQSICRLKDVSIYMCANAIRKDDPVLARMGFRLDKYGIYKKYDKYGLVAVLDFVNPDDYPEFKQAHDKSVAGRIARLFGEDNEEQNKFIEDLPANRRLNNFSYKKGGFSVNIVRGDTIVTLRELKDGNMACVPFANTTAKTLFCLTEKEQGFKLGYHIICNKELKRAILAMISSNIIYYYSEVEYSQLKIIIKGD